VVRSRRSPRVRPRLESDRGAVPRKLAELAHFAPSNSTEGEPGRAPPSADSGPTLLAAIGTRADPLVNPVNAWVGVISRKRDRTLTDDRCLSCSRAQSVAIAGPPSPAPWLDSTRRFSPFESFARRHGTATITVSRANQAGGLRDAFPLPRPFQAACVTKHVPNCTMAQPSEHRRRGLGLAVERRVFPTRLTALLIALGPETGSRPCQILTLIAPSMT
jgi:hypothetical protein